MTLTADRIAALLRATVSTPQDVAREMAEWRAPRSVLWQALIAMAVLDAVILQLVHLIRPFPAQPYGPFLLNPLVLGILQASFAVLNVFGTYWVGRMFGGTGRFDTTIVFLAWLQFVAVFIQLVQLVVLIIIPGLYGLTGIIGFALSLWLFVSFVAVLHGFRSLGLVFAGTVLSILGFAFGLAFVLGVIGALVPGS
ncbi:MAG: Yip1 family protein [Brevirhabdus sp.]